MAEMDRFRKSMRRSALWFAIYAALPGGLPAQQKPDLTVQVKVVNVPATVRDKHGKIIHDLTKDDFTLEEDSRPQSIHYFSQESDLPLTLGLLVDTSLSQRRVLDQERTASFSFLDDMLRPEKDLAFLIHFDFDAELLEDLTDSREKLRSAMDQLQGPDLDRQRGGNSPGAGPGYPRHRGGGSHSGGGTVLYDAVYLASNELMKKQTGRKAIVILSDGVDHGSKESLKDAIEAAQRADTIVYSIFFKGDEPNMGFGGWGGMGGHRGGRGRYPVEQQVDGKKILEQISKETGGRLFEVSGKESVTKIYSQIEEELRNQYSLGYTPDRPDPGSGYHKISLKTKQKDLVVQARAGYYATGR
jgi:VWFA-related protein